MPAADVLFMIDSYWMVEILVAFQRMKRVPLRKDREGLCFCGGYCILLLPPCSCVALI